MLAGIWDPSEHSCRVSYSMTPSKSSRSVCLQSLMSSGTTITQLFDQDKWERHRYVGRYFKNVATIGMSTVFRRIISPCMCVPGATDLRVYAHSCWHIPESVRSGEA